MNTMRFVIFDVKNGVIREWRKYLVAFVVMLVFSFSLLSLSKNYGAAVLGSNGTSLTLGDYMMNMVSGMKAYVLDPQNPFSFPALWMLVFLLIAYITLAYPYQNLKGVGKHLIILSGSRISWWLSKCIWIALSVLSFFAVGMVSIAVWVLVTGGSFSMEVSASTPIILGFDGSILKSSPWDLRWFMVSVLLVTIAICLIQMLIALFLKPVFSYVCTVAVLLFSAYFQSPLFIGNYLMAARSECFVMFGMNPIWGSTLALVVVVIATTLGGIIFKQMDILDWEGVA